MATTSNERPAPRPHAGRPRVTGAGYTLSAGTLRSQGCAFTTEDLSCCLSLLPQTLPPVLHAAQPTQLPPPISGKDKTVCGAEGNV